MAEKDGYDLYNPIDLATYIRHINQGTSDAVNGEMYDVQI